MTLLVEVTDKLAAVFITVGKLATLLRGNQTFHTNHFRLTSCSQSLGRSIWRCLGSSVVRDIVFHTTTAFVLVFSWCWYFVSADASLFDVIGNNALPGLS